jgi:hypothetical protein
VPNPTPTLRADPALVQCGDDDEDMVSVGIGTLTFRGVTAETLTVPQARLASCLVGEGGRLGREVPLHEVARVVYRRPGFTRAVARKVKVLAARTNEGLHNAGVPLGLQASCRDFTLRAYPLPAGLPFTGRG